MNKKILIIVLVVLLIGVGVAVYALVLSPQQAGDKPQQLYYYSPGDFFVTNITDSERLFKATIVLAVTNKNAETELKEINMQIRDIIINIMRQKTEDELRAEDAQDVLREEICQDLREKLKMDYLVTLYYNEFVLQ